MTNLAQLLPGQSAIIDSFTDEEMSLKLLEMGCIPGEEIIMESMAPFGDPILVHVSGYHLSMRKDEAATICISSPAAK